MKIFFVNKKGHKIVTCPISIWAHFHIVQLNRVNQRHQSSFVPCCGFENNLARLEMQVGCLVNFSICKFCYFEMIYKLFLKIRYIRWAWQGVFKIPKYFQVFYIASGYLARSFKDSKILSGIFHCIRVLGKKF